MVSHFSMGTELGFEESPHFTDEAARAMEAHHWPGNVRELKAVIERAALLCENSTIEVDDLMFVQA